MQNAGRQNKDMPDRMVVRQTPPHVEKATHSVRQPTPDKECQAAGGDRRQKRFDGDDNDPTHRHIRQGSENGSVADQATLESDAEESQSPNQAKERPAPRAAQIDQGEGGIGAGNEQVDSGMIEEAQNSFGAGQGDTMVEGGGGIQNDLCRAIDTATDDMPGGTEDTCEGRQNGQARD